MTDVNTELFKRISPEKIEIIKNLTQAELSGVSKATVLRIVKEAGRRNPGTRNYPPRQKSRKQMELRSERNMAQQRETICHGLYSA